jgi:hypothetical protein
MADVKELVDRVRSKLTDEQRSEVGADLEIIKSGYLEKVDEAKAAVAESMERKRKIREYKEENENIAIERDTWKTKFESHDDSELIKDRDKYKEKWTNYITTMQDSFKQFHEKAKESEAWGKVSSEYVIPEEGKELTPDEIESNVSKMQYHTKLGLFEESTPPKPKPPTEKSFKFSDDKVPTTAEYYEIRNQYGPDSYEARKAMELMKKHK